MAHKSDQERIQQTRNIPTFFVEHPQVSWVLLVGVLIWGWFGYKSMPQRKDPNIPVRVALASCSWPGATAQQVEQLITRPIEDTVAQNKWIHAGTPADYGVRSISLPGYSYVYIQLVDNVDDLKRQFSDINLKLNALNGQLPQGAGPISFQSDFGDTAALMLIQIDPDRANVVGISNSDVANSTAAAISGASVGLLKEGNKSIPIVARLRGQERAQLGQIENLYVYSSQQNTRVPLLSVATVRNILETGRIWRREPFST